MIDHEDPELYDKDNHVAPELYDTHESYRSRPTCLVLSSLLAAWLYLKHLVLELKKRNAKCGQKTFIFFRS